MIETRMVGAEQTILDELNHPGMTQDSIAITYYFLLLDHNDGKTPDWAAINAAIKKRWPGKNALARIKRKAWERLDEYIDSQRTQGRPK